VAASIAAALVAALLFAVSATLQQHAARAAALAAPPLSDGPAHRRAPVLPVLGLLARLARDRWWLLGWLTNILGFTAHASALHLGSIAVVQAVLVVQLLFALPLATLRTRARPLRRDWLGTSAVCAGVILLLAVRGQVPQTTARRADILWVVVVAAGLILALLITARAVRAHAQTRTALVAVAAGCCFALTAAFVVFVTADLARRGLVATAFDWPVLGLAASTALGGLLVQDAFAGGSLPTALTAMTITDPVASWVVGAVVFDARAPAGLATVVSCAAAGAVVVFGVALLASSPTLHDERGGRQRERSPASIPS
jgi:hypothetical protein